MPSLRESILATNDLVREPVDIPEWGVTIHVRCMTAGERDRLEIQSSERYKAGKPTLFRASVAVYCACDAEGNPIFEASDVETLAAKSAAPLERINAVALRLSKYTSADVKELEKN